MYREVNGTANSTGSPSGIANSSGMFSEPQVITYLATVFVHAVRMQTLHQESPDCLVVR